MYCPLCKAEYREEFLRCSDCKLDLVQTYEEAQAIQVMQLWEGASLSKFNAVVSALDDANIPNRAESSASPAWRGYVKILALIIRGNRQSLTWKVSVLESDFDAANAVAGRMLD